MSQKKTIKATFQERFSETGLPVFESVCEAARVCAQYHINEGHIIVALFEINPQWVASIVSGKGALPEQIIAIAEKDVQKNKPSTKGGIKIHPSATIFFEQAKKFAEAGGRSQIDYVDLIAALESRIENLIMEQKGFSPTLAESFRQLKRWFYERRRLQ